jgi:hypothetical protein
LFGDIPSELLHAPCHLVIVTSETRGHQVVDVVGTTMRDGIDVIDVNFLSLNATVPTPTWILGLDSISQVL